MPSFEVLIVPEYHWLFQNVPDCSLLPLIFTGCSSMFKQCSMISIFASNIYLKQYLVSFPGTAAEQNDYTCRVVIHLWIFRDIQEHSRTFTTAATAAENQDNQLQSWTIWVFWDNQWHWGTFWDILAHSGTFWDIWDIWDILGHSGTCNSKTVPGAMAEYSSTTHSLLQQRQHQQQWRNITKWCTVPRN